MSMENNELLTAFEENFDAVCNSSLSDVYQSLEEQIEEGKAGRHLHSAKYAHFQLGVQKSMAARGGMAPEVWRQSIKRSVGAFLASRRDDITPDDCRGSDSEAIQLFGRFLKWYQAEAMARQKGR